MKYVFISNFLSHHQIPFSEAMLAEDEFRFIATETLPDERRQLGYRTYSEASVPYLLEVGNDPSRLQTARELIAQADVAILGAAPFSLIEPRIRQGKLTLYYSERLFKRPASIGSLLLKGILLQNYIRPGRQPNVYLLSASAYLPNDLHPLGAFRGRTYRWGYFPKTQRDPLESILAHKQHDMPQILWVGRLIPYKRPQFALHLASQLKAQGDRFHLTLIGNGELEPQLKAAIVADRLEDSVELAGSMPPEAVRQAMNQADIFIYTANRQEGWGAVLNEAMNSACGVVCCRDIGSAPYLVRDGENGLLFDGADQKQLLARVRSLIDEPDRRRRLGEQAYRTITEVWNAEEAARRLRILCRSLLETGDCSQFEDGPCSKAGITRRGRADFDRP